ncbi:MAG TPA: hypothetical protein PKH31_12345 [Candidatus Sumerlaeota bacterium]|nr:hypothetical protein [Candidatus Sumerlaeota bacterium]
MKRTLYPVLFVWIPFGIPTGTGMEGITAIYHLSVLLAAGLILEKLLTRRP